MMSPQRSVNVESVASSSDSNAHALMAPTQPPSVVAIGAPTLPQELADLVVGNLSHDTASLRLCSLVCRSWAQVTAAHLFRHRRWPKCQHYWTRIRKIANCTCACDRPTTLPALREFLVASARVSHALRELEFNFERVPGGARPDASDFMSTGYVNVDELMDVFDAAPRLKSVKIRSLQGSSWPAKDKSGAGRAGRSLETLQISRTPYFFTYDMTALITYFAHIGTVTIGPDVRPLLPQNPPTFPAAERTRIGALDFHPTCYAQSVVKCLQVLGPVIDASRLTEVSFNLPLPEEDIDSFVSFLDAATALDRFAVMFREVKARGREPGYLALEHWTSLMRLLPHCSARRIVVHRECTQEPEPMVPADFEEYFRGFAWRQVDEAIASNGKLEMLQFRTCSGLDMGDFDILSIRDYVRPMLSARLFNILSFAVLQRSEYQSRLSSDVVWSS